LFYVAQIVYHIKCHKSSWTYEYLEGYVAYVLYKQKSLIESKGVTAGARTLLETSKV